MATKAHPKRITIADVAKAANVSAMTVSRVVNRDPKVKDQTRRLVEEVIKQLNYTPNVVARNLATGVAPRIAILRGNPSHAYVSELLFGALEEASRLGVQLIVEQADADLKPETLAARFGNEWDAVIVPPPMSDIPGIRKIIREHWFPSVFIGSAKPSDDTQEIRIDDRQAAYELTQYLISKGHQRIGFIKGNPNQSVSAQRYAGYCQAIEQQGISLDPELTQPGLFTYKSGAEASDGLLRLKAPPTAIFASNDDMAAGALATAAAHGLSVPEQLSVVGFDDSPIASLVWPALTTVRQPVSAMGSMAINTAFQDLTMTAGERAWKIEVARHELIERSSAGARP
ncbi:MAG: LacI family DNA-binding transcriptional regulator [Parvularculaceae bacterium]|nr:LacI family DNA-binding transcriptional regulator [Parvularculaceae bacterium]